MQIDVTEIIDELNVDEACALDILYLRTRNRHTDKLESELIALHKAGTPPNIMEFGVTKETQEALLNMAKKGIDHEC